MQPVIAHTKKTGPANRAEPHGGVQSGHSSYYYIDIGIILAGAVLVLNGDLLLGGLLFAAGCVVHFDWLGMGIFK